MTEFLTTTELAELLRRRCTPPLLAIDRTGPKGAKRRQAGVVPLGRCGELVRPARQ